jgi:hypothetical protein
MQREFCVGDRNEDVPIHGPGMVELLKYLKFREPTPAVDAFLGCQQIQEMLSQYWTKQILAQMLDDNGRVVSGSNLSNICVQYMVLGTFTTHYLAHSVWGDDAK